MINVLIYGYAHPKSRFKNALSDLLLGSKYSINFLRILLSTF